MSCKIPVKAYCDCRDNDDETVCITSGWKKVTNNRTIKCEFYEEEEV